MRNPYILENITFEQQVINFVCVFSVFFVYCVVWYERIYRFIVFTLYMGVLNIISFVNCHNYSRNIFYWGVGEKIIVYKMYKPDELSTDDVDNSCIIAQAVASIQIHKIRVPLCGFLVQLTSTDCINVMVSSVSLLLQLPNFILL